MTEPNAWDLGGGGDSFPFDKIGDEIEGYVQEMIERQGSDMETGEPAWWDKEQTRPKMITVLTLQTNLREIPNDDGRRSVTLSGSKKPESRSRMAAALGAVKAATGGSQMQFNAWFKMRFVEEGAPVKRGYNGPKYYEAWYRPPVMDLDGNDQTAPANKVADDPGYRQGHAGTADPWDVSQPATGGPDFAQPDTVGIVSSSDPGHPSQSTGIPVATIAGLKAAGMDPADVFGPGWESRVTP